MGGRGLCFEDFGILGLIQEIRKILPGRCGFSLVGESCLGLQDFMFGFEVFGPLKP